ncbi:MAG: hypothetical protein KAU21_09435 [Gammaproteobacteria bacterium]|nr:hypothetical protein [Gammaproteobacteria bacterium]
MRLITHPNHINKAIPDELLDFIIKRFQQLAEETDAPPIIILVKPDDDITGPDYAFIGNWGLLSDLYEEHEPEQKGFVRPFEWVSYPADEVSKRGLDGNNNFFNCSSFNKVNEDGDVNAKKENFFACHCLILDDVDTKVSKDALEEFPFSWKLETSRGNYQYGLLFEEPVTDGKIATLILDAFIERGWCDAGASGPMSRWARLPVGINGKPKYNTGDGKPFQCQLSITDMGSLRNVIFSDQPWFTSIAWNHS